MATRIISSAVGIAIAAVVLIFHTTYVLNAAIGIISVIMLYELLKATKCLQNLFVCIPAMLYALTFTFWNTTKYSFMISFAYVLVTFVIMIITHKDTEYENVLKTIAVTLLISNAMGTLIALHEYGILTTGKDSSGLMYLIMGLCGAWLADSAAYFVGTFMGKNKLCPEISPKKTIEGFIGGIIITGFLFMLINFIYSKIVSDVTVNYFELLILGMMLAVVGTLGDLSASVLKRKCGIKDYGNIMPGHGGLMDRFDSVVFVAPFLYAFVIMFNIYE